MERYGRFERLTLSTGHEPKEVSNDDDEQSEKYGRIAFER